MPEGPEIRRAADRVAAAIAGRPLVHVDLKLPQLEADAPLLVGATVSDVETRGKAMLTRFDNGLTLYSHNQLYGRWYIADAGQMPETGRALRVALHTDRASALLYSASEIELLDDEELARHPFLTRLGPDVLDPALTSAAVTRRLRDPAYSGRSLAALYLDQGFLAGNGNYLRSEVLWAARVWPGATARDLDRAALDRLGRQSLLVPRRSWRSAGATAPRAAVRQRIAQGMSFNAARFQIYGRDGRPCYRCATTIERQNAASRGLFYCPRCQAA